MLLENQQLGRYHIVRLLGSGGMGDVYLAEDVRINQQVAVKAICSEVSSSQDEHVRLFEREAKAIAKLDHANILPLFDYGEQQIGKTQVMYLVMPYRREGSLTQWLMQKKPAGPLSFQQTIHLVVQAAEALQHAHSRQIIHQDVKPSNFLIRERESTPNFPDILLADFGIARLTSATVNASQSIRGTPTYMAPEQYAGHPVSASDQYALAVTVYELLTGIPPFRGGPMQIMYQHLHDQPQPASSLNHGLSQDVDTVLLHALAKQPEARFASVTAFANALQQAIQNTGALRATIPPQSISLTNAIVLPINPNTPAIEESHDLKAILAISTEEALKGTTRTITLPGGRHVPVTIPPGVQDGQEVHLSTPEDTETGGKREILVLTILVKKETEDLPPAFGTKNEQALIDNKEEMIESDVATVFSVHSSPLAEEKGVADSPVQSGASAFTDSGRFSRPNKENLSPLPAEEGLFPTLPITVSASSTTQPTFTTAQEREDQGTPLSNTHRRSKVGLLWLLAIVLILTSIFGITSYRSHLSQVDANIAATAFAQNKATSTAVSEAQATQEVETALTKATGTAAAQATKTVQAQVQATAAVVKANPYPAYLAGQGKFALYDSLRPPTQWYATATDPDCKISGNVYHVITPTSQYFTPCYDNNGTAFTNFALEVQMTIVQGACGGILFRGDASQNTKFYLYKVCQDKTYGLIKYISNTGTDATILPDPSTDNAAINAGLNQTNTIAIVAQGSTLTLYINQQQIASVQDTSFTKGTVALIAYPDQDPTDVIYNNVRIWTF